VLRRFFSNSHAVRDSEPPPSRKPTQ
jgi:hypothetical protein